MQSQRVRLDRTMIKKLPWPEISVGLLAIVIAAGVYLYAHRHEAELEESKRRGAVIVQALEAHRARAGAYPDSLHALVPGQLRAIEQPTWGLRRWRYRRLLPASPQAGDREYFQLSVAASASGYPVLYYDITTARWVLNN